MSKQTARNISGFYETLKRRSKAEEDTKNAQKAAEEMETIALDDTQRTKILSPGRLIAKRFFRNKLALVGLALLILMFTFTFAGPLFYPYSQTQIFYKYDLANINYASAIERTEYVLYKLPEAPDIQNTVINRFNSYINAMKADELAETIVTAADNNDYMISRLGDAVYLFSTGKLEQIGTFYQNAEIATYDRLPGTFTYNGDSFPVEFERLVIAAVNDSADSIEYNGEIYNVSRLRNLYTITLTNTALELYSDSPGNDFQNILEENIGGEFEYGGNTYLTENTGRGIYAVMTRGDKIDICVASTFVFNSYDVSSPVSDEFKIQALLALYDTGEFTADGSSYSIRTVDNDIYIADASGEDVVELSRFAVRRYSGQDTLSIDFKHHVQELIEDMQEAGITETQFIFELHAIDSDGTFLYDDNGNPLLEDTEITITRKNTGEYVMMCEQITYLIDIFATPNEQNIFGTDGDGMDLLARFMYGGRISLLVGFVVVFLEIIIGVILGGISGFFGGVVDTIIMRLVDVFYCIPSLPILIIMGAMFDAMKMDPYERLMWMMVTLGILGWAGIARLVRGQILSLREQEFMTAQEATGMKNRKRIFRHLVPNVMPLLIVSATMGIGSVIISESTLSFLGLGVKHPLATWGTIINSVTNSSDAMIRYAYIWVPAGVLISLSVIAFNFVGDGLRDAFDPKMKT